MPKVRTVIYLETELLAEIDRKKIRFAVSRSMVTAAAIQLGIHDVDKTLTVRRRGRGARPGPPGGTPLGQGYVSRRRAPVAAAQRILSRVGQTILRVTPTIPPDEFRDALIAEAPVHLPGVDVAALDIDTIVDALYDDHEGDLVRVPGDAPPEDPPD